MEGILKTDMQLGAEDQDGNNLRERGKVGTSRRTSHQREVKTWATNQICPWFSPQLWDTWAPEPKDFKHLSAIWAQSKLPGDGAWSPNQLQLSSGWEHCYLSFPPVLNFVILGAVITTHIHSQPVWSKGAPFKVCIQMNFAGQLAWIYGSPW